MHQPTDTHRTAKDLSPEELAQYRQRLDQHFQNRKVDEALLQRAWQTAHRVAAMLYEDFGATQVAVFGSLAGQNGSQNRQILMWSSGGFLETYISTRCGKPETLVESSKSILSTLTVPKDVFESGFKVKPSQFNEAKQITVD